MQPKQLCTLYLLTFFLSSTHARLFGSYFPTSRPDVAAAVMQFQQSVSWTTKRWVVPLGHTHTLIFSRQISESDRTYVRTCTYKYVIDPTDRPPVAKSTTRSPLSLLIALCLHMWAVQTLTLTLNAHTRTHAQDMHVCVCTYFNGCITTIAYIVVSWSCNVIVGIGNWW